ncbi:MAG: adenosylcobinamide kinase/adenosylcobinamide-phosphate guanylyltransferase [Clostridium butyricum]|nr:adenosylcobinamide kinase/adenosylcobinamide-phosphate guanylyltransferase [Clostridium butyricum]
MNYLIIGGSKSGKSQISEDIALKLNNDKVIYIATMKPFDKEDEERIKKHIKSREGLDFITIEKQKNLYEIINEIKEHDTVLIDSITSLLTNEMFVGNKIIYDPSIRIITSLDLIMNKAENVIIVSDFIFNDSMEYDDITEIYKKELGIINRHLARLCENVIECVFGNVKYHKKSD